MVYSFAWSYWVWAGLIYLLIMTYFDVFRGNRFSVRWNSVMLGLSISLYSHIRVPWWFFLAMIGVLVVLRWVLSIRGYFSSGDINALTWLVVGFGVLNVVHPGIVVLFFVVLVLLSLCWVGVIALLKWRLRVRSMVRMAYMPVLLGSFLITCLVFGVF